MYILYIYEYIISYYITSYCLISYYNSNYIIYILCLYMYGLHVSYIWCCIWIICGLHAGWNVVRIKRIKVVTHFLAGIHPPKYIHLPSRMKPGHWGMISGDLIRESLCHVSEWKWGLTQPTCFRCFTASAPQQWMDARFSLVLKLFMFHQ